MVEELNSVEIRGRKLYYRTVWHYHGDWGNKPSTQFFESYTYETIRKRKSFFSFDTVLELRTSEVLFSIDQDAEDTSFTKEWWRNSIGRELDKLKREEEIKVGKLI
jgi:hypothetical protein